MVDCYRTKSVVEQAVGAKRILYNHCHLTELHTAAAVYRVQRITLVSVVCASTNVADICEACVGDNGRPHAVNKPVQMRYI